MNPTDQRPLHWETLGPKNYEPSSHGPAQIGCKVFEHPRTTLTEANIAPRTQQTHALMALKNEQTTDDLNRLIPCGSARRRHVDLQVGATVAKISE